MTCLRGWLFGMLALAAAGCVTTTDTPAPQAAADPATTAPNTETAAAPPPEEAYEPPDPTQVVGMRQHEVLRLLGEPSLIRTESTAEVWQYKHSGCVMDLFLYQNGQPNVSEVVYFELRDLEVGQHLPEMAARYCFGHMLNT